MRLGPQIIRSLQKLSLALRLKKVLPSIINDAQTGYIKSRFIGENNDYASNCFELHRGVRQGCPLSGLLFFLTLEILYIAIRASCDIKGIQIANREIKLSQYADDTIVFCRDIFSLGKLLDLLNTFFECYQI